MIGVYKNFTLVMVWTFVLISKKLREVDHLQ